MKKNQMRVQKHRIVLFLVMSVLITTHSPLEAKERPEVTPCSSRADMERVEYTIDANIKDPKQAVSSWQIERGWGIKERLEVVPEEGNTVLRVHYPEGSINPGHATAPRGGVGFYARKGFEAGREHACLQYKVFFPTGFDFVRGGKLPGLYGGEPPSGCKEGAEFKGFSARYMWREAGKGTLYAYFPGKKEACGALLGLGNWVFTPGTWMTIEQEILLGEAEDHVRVWVDGRQRLDYVGQVRPTKTVALEGVMFHSFFGGKDESWASPKAQYTEFKDISVFFPKTTE